MTKKPDSQVGSDTGVPYSKARRSLGLATWEMELAVNSGLLVQRKDGSVESRSLASAMSDPVSWRARLSDEELLNATEAASVLGVSVMRFHRLRKMVVPPIKVQCSEPWKYGRTIRYWRRGDVATLRSALIIESGERELRRAARAVDPAEKTKRSAAAKKAAATRRERAAAKLAAQAWLDATGIATSTDPLDVLAYGAAMRVAFKADNDRFRPLYSDRQVAAIAAELSALRVAPAEQMSMILDRKALESEAWGAVERLGAPVSGLPVKVFRRLADEHGVPHVGNVIKRSDLEVSLRSSWFAQATQHRRDVEAERARAAAERAEQARLRAELNRAEQAPMPPGEAAALLGVDEALCAQYARMWSLRTVAQATTAAARASVPVADYLDLELAERRCRSDEAKRQRAKQIASWRTAWERELGLPAHALDAANVPRYGKAERRKVDKWKSSGRPERSAPAWIKPILWSTRTSTVESVEPHTDKAQVLSRPSGFPRAIWSCLVLPALKETQGADRKLLRSSVLTAWEANRRSPTHSLERIIGNAMASHRANPTDGAQDGA